MPTPAKTSLAALVSIASQIVESAGAEALTLSSVAQSAGVKAPSLYKHFADRAALLKAVEIGVLHELEAWLRAEMSGATPKARLISLAHAYRRFGVALPHRYAIIYTGNARDDADIRNACLFSAQPLFEELQAAGIAAARLLPLSRTLVAFLHGFVSMQNVEAFQLGGDIDDAFEAALEIILREVG